MDSRVRGLQIVIGRNSGFLIVLHSSRLQIHAFDVGRAADADQDLVDGHGEFVIVADQIDELLISFCTHIAGFGVEMDANPIARQGVRENLRRVTLLIAQEHRIVLHDADLRTQSTKGLRQFASERTTAENEQTARAFLQVKNTFIGQITCLGDSGNRRKRRSRTASDQRPLEAQPLPLNHNRFGSGCASPKYTSTPIELSLCAEIRRPMRARTRRIRSITAENSTLMPVGTCAPQFSALRISAYKREVRMIALEDMHPTLKHVPPKRSRSMSATFAPTLAALRAVSIPAAPAPMIAKLTNEIRTTSGWWRPGVRSRGTWGSRDCRRGNWALIRFLLAATSSTRRTSSRRGLTPITMEMI
jgi:hypothetical protein